MKKNSLKILFLHWFWFWFSNFLYLCGSWFGGLIVFIETGGLVLLLYMDQRATLDISNAFNASRCNSSGLCEPKEMKNEMKFKYRNFLSKKNYLRLGSFGVWNILMYSIIRCSMSCGTTFVIWPRGGPPIIRWCEFGAFPWVTNDNGDICCRPLGDRCCGKLKKIFLC